MADKAKCPYCGEVAVTTKIIPEYHGRLGGSPLTVKDARIEVCDKCGGRIYSAHEIRRWELIQAQAKNERLRECLTDMVNLTEDYNGQRMPEGLMQLVRELRARAKDALKGEQP